MDQRYTKLNEKVGLKAAKNERDVYTMKIFKKFYYSKSRFSKSITSILALVLFLSALSYGCNVRSENQSRTDALSYDDALKELSALSSKIRTREIQAVLDLSAAEAAPSDSLASIDTFPIMVKGNGQIDIEIAAATEISADGDDNWLNLVAEKFNREGYTIDGKTVTASVRKITSGEVVTYMNDGDYRPDVYIPSNEAWGEMLKASGFEVVTVKKRIAGNTAGILMEKATYDEFIEKYKEVTVANVLTAANAGDLLFAYTNPYTSSTGLNIFTAMLAAFDTQNPLSSTASEKLIEYQKTAPTAAYTTAELRNKAAKGIIKAMVMEEQAYHNTPALKDYVYVPQGIRHDHPVYTFGYVDKDSQEAAKMFAEYCLNSENQKLASEKGFNLHEDYVSVESGLDGAGYLAAQKLWKQNKNGGVPVIGVFVADISGSMDGLPLNSLKESLIATAGYIGEENYIGLVSYSNNVYIDLPIAAFDDMQRAYFSGAVKALQAGGGTATYDAVLVGLNMLIEKQKEIPNAKLILFVLSDGDQNEGYTLDRVTGIVGGLQIPVYTIGYNVESDSRGEQELKTLSDINEATLIKSGSEDIVNNLRNLFNVQM
ncbi:MAG: VWA domain-containing protein [Lachnospiraceae bacterium]|jgi:Ca-activated chloride channel family protein|nr:VWA domain-containing protein [Lachnospiraceae bacterium]